MKGFYVCYELYGFMTSHYVENYRKVEAFLDNLEENGMDPEELAKVRVYPALSWQVRNALLDQDGDLKFWVWMVGILLLAAPFI